MRPITIYEGVNFDTKVTSDTTFIITPRQNEVLQLICDGLANKQIATVLKISEQTVKNHISEMMKSTKCPNRVNLAVKSLRGELTLIEV